MNEYMYSNSNDIYEKTCQYDAFISYRHREPDMTIARAIQSLLENYRHMNQKKLHIFLDNSELPTSYDLGGNIRNALCSSRFLIIICSSSYQSSKWCMEELNYFLSIHPENAKRIIPVLVDSEPDIAFPDAIRFVQDEILLHDGSKHLFNREIEPIAADLRAASKAKMLYRLKSTEQYRILACILNVRFDELYQRAERAKKDGFCFCVYNGFCCSVALLL